MHYVDAKPLAFSFSTTVWLVLLFLIVAVLASWKQQANTDLSSITLSSPAAEEETSVAVDAQAQSDQQKAREEQQRAMALLFAL